MFLEDSQIQCPHCGESMWVEIDPSGTDRQEYIEDCQVCCKPITLRITRNPEGEFEVYADGMA